MREPTARDRSENALGRLREEFGSMECCRACGQKR